MPEADAVAHGRPSWKTLISGSITNGTFELIEEVRVTPGGPYPHVHHGRDEAFHVLAGRYSFLRDREEARLGPGDSIFVPRGTRHGFRTLDPSSRTLIVVAPAGLEAFFREMGRMLESGMSALEAMTAPRAPRSPPGGPRGVLPREVARALDPPRRASGLRHSAALVSPGRRGAR
jgi:mannose-6-phosphate isomerase-like protein (cupin superfamily)